MKPFATITTYFDDGSVTCNIKPSEGLVEGVKGRRFCDVWTDFFETMEEAENFKQESLKGDDIPEV